MSPIKQAVALGCYSFVFIIIIILQAPLNEAYKDGLYSTEDDVVPLSNATFMKKVVKNEDNVIWAVEFYNSWCGHCIHFAPTWKKLASSLKGWNDFVRIAAIDCSQSINLDICRKFEIDKFPLIKLFSSRSKKDDKQQFVMRPMNAREIDLMVRKIIEFITEFPVPSLPRLQPLQKIQDIWSEKTDKHEVVAIIFEGPESLVGRSVVLDMRNTPNVLVRTMLSKSVAHLGLTHFPSLYQISVASTLNLTLIGKGNKMASEDHRLFVKMLQVLSKGKGGKHNFSLSSKNNSPLGDDQKPKANDVNKFKISIPSSPSNRYVRIDRKKFLKTKLNPDFMWLRVSMQDLESALHYGFRQEIAICKSIEGNKFKALQKFVQALLKFFPGKRPTMQFLQAVSGMLSGVVTNQLSGEEWITKIDNLQNSQAFLPEVIEWDCCKGSSPRYRGYPCAMWTLFHVLTVSAYTQQSVSGRALNPLEAPLAIRGYMKHFFGCEECSKHFLDMASTMERNISDVKGAVLWLWSAHNMANHRLKGDESEDKAFPKVQFPSPELCPDCHSAQEKNTSQPVWNMESVLKFLISFYIEKNIYFSPELSKRQFLVESAVDLTHAKFESELSKNELDWWEKKQGEQDLKQVRRLRNRKKDNSLGRNMRIEDGGTDNRAVEPVDVFMKRKSSGWIFTDLDLSMCVVFYMISTCIIFFLYHHFIVRRNIVPCAGVNNCRR